MTQLVDTLRQGRWRLNPQRPFLVRRFEDAAVMLDEATGNTHRMSLPAANILKALRVEPLDPFQPTAILAERDFNTDQCLALLQELSVLGLVISPDDDTSASPAISS